MSAQIAFTTFNPADDSREYRNALGRFATGVTVITAVSDDGPVGITVNSFSSVSIDPPLILWSPDKKSNRYSDFSKADKFAVHVLAANQKNICDGFSKSKTAFSDFDYAMNNNDLPIISNCLAVFECKRFNQFEAGDHSIIIGKVEEVHLRSGNGLIFTNGRFLTDVGTPEISPR